MIKRNKVLEEFERKMLRENLPYEKKLEIYEAMLEEARALGIFPLKNPLEGIEKDIELSRRLRSVKGTAEETGKDTE